MGFIKIVISRITLDKNQFKQDLALYSPGYIKKKLETKYLSPENILLPKLNPKWDGVLDDLNKNGYGIISDEFKKEAEILKNMLQELDLYSYKEKDNVLDYSFLIGFSNKTVLDIMKNQFICNLCCSFFKRQAFYRGHPQIISMSSANVTRSSAFPHIDGYKQLDFWLMLSDMNEKTTQFYIYPPEIKNLSNDISRKKRKFNSKAKGINAKFGDLLILNVGSNFHFGKYRDKKRVVLHMSTNTGWLPTLNSEKFDSDLLKSCLDKTPDYVKNMFTMFNN